MKNGIRFNTLFFLVLFILKSCNVLDWSWWLIAAPIWIPILFLEILLSIYGAITILKEKKEEDARKKTA